MIIEADKEPTVRLSGGQLHHSCELNHGGRQSRQHQKLKNPSTTLNSPGLLHGTPLHRSQSVPVVGFIQGGGGKRTYFFLLSAISQELLELYHVDEVG